MSAYHWAAETRLARLSPMKTIVFAIELERLVTDYQQHLFNDAGLTAESCRVWLFHLRAFLRSRFTRAAPSTEGRSKSDFLSIYCKNCC